MRGATRSRRSSGGHGSAGEDPYNSRIALRYMQALEAAGDRAGALRHANVHSDLLRTELDAAPEREVVALAERLRLESRAASEALAAPLRPRPFPSRPTAISAESTSRLSRAPGRREHAAAVGCTALVLVLAVVVGLGVLGGALSRARSPELAPRRVAAAALREPHRAAGPR